MNDLKKTKIIMQIKSLKQKAYLINESITNDEDAMWKQVCQIWTITAASQYPSLSERQKIRQ